MNLPPYGKPPLNLDSAGTEQPPGDWAGDAAAWAQFFDRLRDDIATHIWPIWNPQTKNWEGASTAFAEQATQAENALCITHLQQAGILDELPDARAYSGANDPMTQHWHYVVEDQIGCALSGTPFEVAAGTFPGRNAVFYDSDLDPDAMQALFGRMAGDKYRGLFRLKLFFRRPRPQQTAFLFGQDDFIHHQARNSIHTGNHPALISGHCAQGLLLMCSLVDDLMSTGQVIDPDKLHAYGQFAVDFGDRRVFAGVHYPTDNIASWIAVVRVIEHVFGAHAPVIRAFIVNALKTQSTVYRIVRDHFPAHPELAHAWAFLENEIGN